MVPWGMIISDKNKYKRQKGVVVAVAYMSNNNVRIFSRERERVGPNLKASSHTPDRDLYCRILRCFFHHLPPDHCCFDFSLHSPPM